MPNSITTAHETIDFADPIGKPAHIKELALHVARLEAQLRQAGIIELKTDTLRYLMDAGVRQAVAEIMQDSVSLDLGESELPVLFRSALLEAYLHEKLAAGLGEMEEIDIALNAYENDVVSKPVGLELLQRLRSQIERARKKEDVTDLENALTELEELLQKGVVSFDVYQQVFGHSLGRGFSSLVSSLHQGMGADALAVPPSQNLAADHLGGRSRIDQIMHFATRTQDSFSGGADEAYTNDRMRQIFSGGEQRKPHQVRTYSGEWYKGLSANEKWFVNTTILRNLADALCVDEARTLFPKTVPADVFLQAMAQNSFGLGTQIGIRSSGEDACVLDTDENTGLDNLAKGMQAVIDAHRATSREQGLMVVDQSQVASEQRRRRQNISLFSMFGDSNYCEGEEFEMPIEARNLWEYLEVTDDPELQTKLYQAFVRRFGEYYRGTTPEESWTHSQIRLTRDGTVTCRYVDDEMYEENTDDEPWDLFEAVQRKDIDLPEDYEGSTDPFSFTPENDPYGLLAEYRAVQARTGYFHPNMSKLIAALRDEMRSFDPLLYQARIVSGESSVKIEKSLLWSLNREIEKRILDARERLTLLQDFVNPDQSEWLEALGLDEMPSDETAIRDTYRSKIKATNAHPDMHTDNPSRMQEAADDFKRLTRARDELASRIESHSPNSVSVYVGKPLDIVNRSTQKD